MSDFQAKKEGLQLLAALSDDNTKAVFVRSFESHLSDLTLRLLDPDIPDSEVQALRWQAVGVLRVLDKIGVQREMATDAAVRRATQKRVLQAVGEDVG